MVEFVPQEPKEKTEKANAGAEQQASKTALSQEAFRPQEVQRVADNQTDKPKDPAQVYQTVFAELSAAKQGMLAVNDVIAKGGGPYAQGDGLKAYQGTLEQAQQHYTAARLAADSFLYVCDKNGNPTMDSQGHPIPSKENLALQQQLAGMQKDMQQLANDQSPEGRQKLAQEMQATHQISDLLRSSGYARANNAFALMFHSGDLKGQDHANFAKTGVALLAMASKFDPAMMGPPPDANFAKHYDAAMNAVLGGNPAANNGDRQPNQGDTTKPGNDRQQPPKPGDAPPQTAGNANLVADGNQYYVNYRGLHVPTWTGKNPDGSATQPFKVGDGPARTDGMLKPVTDANGKVVGAGDGLPLMDSNGMRRINDSGQPVPAQFDATDPSTMLAQTDRAVGNKPLDDAARAQYNKVIESSDKLDRVSMAKALDLNDQFIKNNPEAAKWEGEYRQLNAQLGATFNDLGKFRQGLTQPQLDGLQKMWSDVKTPQDIDTWLNNPANKASKDALTSDPQKWNAIKDSYSKYLTVENQIKAKEADLAKNPDLQDKVRKVRSADAMNQELSRLFASSIDTRAGYVSKLLDQDDVKKYIGIADKNSADAKALENDPNVKDVKRVLTDMAKCNPALAQSDNLVKTGKALGLDIPALVGKPVDTTKPAGPVDTTKPAGPVDSQKPAGPVDTTKPAGPVDTTKPAGPVDTTKPAGPVDTTKPAGPVDTTKPAGPVDTTKPAGDATQKPNDGTADQQKPAAPADASRVALTDEQSSAPNTIDQAYSLFLQGSEKASKPMDAAKFAEIAPVWEKAIAANASIKPEQLKAYEDQAQNDFANRMALVVAAQKTGKGLDKIEPADMKNITMDDVKKAMSDSITNYKAVTDNYNNALKALNPQDQKKFADAEQAFSATLAPVQKAAQATLDAATKDAAGDQTKLKAAQAQFDATMQAAAAPAFKAKIDAEKAINPDLAKAIDAQIALANDPSAAFAKQYLKTMQTVDLYKHVSLEQVQYAQALAVQGGDANLAKAKTYLSEAMKDADTAKLLQSTTDGAKLLQALGLKTPDMVKLQNDQDKLFPEMKLAREATDAASGKNWKDADDKFKAAEASIDQEVMQKGGGKTVAESIANINRQLDGLKMAIGMDLTRFQSGDAGLPPVDGQSDADRAKQEQLIRSVLQGDPNGKPPVPAMNQADMISALSGEKGPQMQAVMQRILTKSDQDTLSKINVLSTKIQNVAIIRMQHAIKASEFGFKNNDQAAKDEAKTIVQSIGTVDPETFKKSPEVVGALRQAEDGKQINVENGVAAANAFDAGARASINATQKGELDTFFPGVTMALHSVTGDNKETHDAIVKQMMLASLANSQEEQRLHDETVKNGNTAGRHLAGDLLGVGTSFAAGWGISKALTAGAEYLPLPGWAKFGVVAAGAIGAGGLVNNEVSGRTALDWRGYARDGVGTATTFGFIKGMNNIWANQTLSEATMSKLATDGVVKEGVTGLTGAQVTKLVAAETNTSIGFGQYAKNLLPALSPIKFAPAAADVPAWQLWNRGISLAGLGGERSVALFAEGRMGLAELATRQLVVKTASAAGLAYTAGALNEGTKIYTGDRFDGKQYNTMTDYLSSMNDAGKKNALAAALFIPGTASLAESIGGRLIPGSISTAVSSRLSGVLPAGFGSSLYKSVLVMAQPTADAAQPWSDSRLYDKFYQEAQAKTAEMKAAAEKQLQQQQQQQQQQQPEKK